MKSPEEPAYIVDEEDKEVLSPYMHSEREQKWKCGAKRKESDAELR
jgi:hypothetical protein